MASRIIAILIAATVLGGVATAFYQLRPPPPPPAPKVRTVVILPFHAATESLQDRAFALGTADALTHRLREIRGLTLTPTRTTRRYTAPGRNALEIARELGVEAVVDGAYGRTGRGTRVAVRLLRTQDGASIWSETFEEGDGDFLLLQGRTARALAAAIAPSLSSEVMEAIAQPITADREAFVAYATGLVLEDSDLANARYSYRGALSRDPRFALAWAGSAAASLAQARVTRPQNRALVDDARTHAQAAIALDPALAAPHATLAAVFAGYDWKWDYAEVELRRAIELDDASSHAHAAYASFSAERGRGDLALAESARALRLDPGSPEAVMARGFCLRLTGRAREAVAHFEKAVAMHPAEAAFRIQLVRAYASCGDIAAASRELASVTNPRRPQVVEALSAYLVARSGQAVEATRMLKELEAQERASGRADPPTMALAWTAAGNRERAFAWLERAYQNRLPALRTLAVDADFAPLRDDARYLDLVRRVGL